MDVLETLKQVDSNLLVFLLTSLIAFLTWVIKGSIEKPINDSKQTFEKTFNIRIEIMTEIKNRLSLILYFKEGENNLKFKEEIQSILLKDGKSAYLSKNILDNLLRLSIEEKNNEELIKTTINLIDSELYLIISKLEDEISFYRKFSNFNPLKKIIGIILLALQNIITILIVGFITYLLITTFISSTICVKILISLLSIGILLFANWYLSKK
ncbi:hypothetical protein [Myroides]|uniref:Uncharacterized protein n=1 Tax=Myroides indicus TaxID=1323422 RepID=A0A4R7F461_9FLAO|nr:hypothetical protein [Myroides]APA93462.1 hypothetical protein BK054_14750 [Myroides sp. ZB35]MDM1035330.1 hypothetical protein [Myroides odoratimimus]MDM1460449.1 hypothetical protein [Myroides odoratimimus]TDS64391.1 hypothetical protein C8P70_104109 [Myroides indicus]